MEIPLVPVAIFGGGRSRPAGGGDVLDVVAADRNEAADPVGPQRGDDAGGASAPVIAGEDRALEAERLDQIEEIAPQRRLLARSRGSRIEKPGRAVAAQIGRDDAKPGGGEPRRDLV